jgi:hypothetical protein
VCLLVRRSMDFIVVTLVSETLHDARLAPPEGQACSLHLYGLQGVAVLAGTLALPSAAPLGQELLAAR